MAGMILYLFVIAFISVPLAMIAKYLGSIAIDVRRLANRMSPPDSKGLD
jgi:hypothetical protein